MLPKSKRLTGNDFKGLKTRIAYRGACFDIAVAKHTETKFACIISKKRIRKAVDRNKVKRKVYAALHGMEVSSPSYVLIYPTRSILTTPFSSVREDLQKVFATL